jgi:glycolate oxidase subunit GlcD
MIVRGNPEQSCSCGNLAAWKGTDIIMLKESVLGSLKTLLPRGQVFTDRASLVAYEVDAGLDKGAPEGIVFPHSTEDVCKIARWASKHQVPLIARGAGTGLSGGAVADRGGVIVEFVHMNRIVEVDVQGRCATVEPALINLRLDERVKAHDLYFPPDPSSQRASTMGGNVAENSGGPHCFKYGVTTNYVLGMEVVLADGQRIKVGGRASDYPEYDLCGLLTGSEGTLGLITSMIVRLVRNPPGVKTLLATFDSVEQAGEAVSAIIAAGLVPATMEMMDRNITRIVEPFAHANLPIDAGAVLIVEVDGYPASLDPQADEIVRILEAYRGSNIRVARDEEERAKIWLARKSAAGAMARLAPAFYIVDVTVPRSHLAEILGQVDEISRRHNFISGHVFHAGDGNLHPNISIPDPTDKAFLEEVRQAGREMVERCVEVGGSLTGEHGVGIEKREFMPLMHNPEEMMAFWNIKQAFDPHCLLNPGKMFPTSIKFDGVPANSAESAKTPTGEISTSNNIFTPETAEQAAQGLLALGRAGRGVSIDRPSKRNNVVQLSTAALHGIVTYAPEDLYITVRAGTPLREVQEFLDRDGKQLPIISPWPRASVGGVIAANNNAPLRMRYGAIRDITLCATAALADGRVIRTGRPLVKNVAGYDLTRLFVGSHGTLGLITDVSFKITTKPRMCKSLLVPVQDLRYGLIWARQILPFALTASGIVLSKTPTGEISASGVDGRAETSLAKGLPESDYVLTYTAEGLPQDVQAELAQVRQALASVDAPKPIEVDTLHASDIWMGILGPGQAAGTTLKVRVGLPVRDLPAYVQDQAALLNQGAFIADIANGYVYATMNTSDIEKAKAWLNGLRVPALQREGYTVVIGMPDSMQSQLDRWGYQPAGLDLMHRIKAQWDPYGIMNPGEFL